MHTYIRLFLVFAKIGVMTFGGGYGMIPIIRRETVESRPWMTEDEFADMTAVGQCTPGVIAVNMATYVGYKHAGALGGIIATLGIVFPSTIIITIVAIFLRTLTQYAVVQSAFAGIRVAICAMIIKTVLQLRKTGINDLAAAVVFLVVLVLSVFIGIHPAILAITSGVFGVVYNRLRKRSAES